MLCVLETLALKIVVLQEGSNHLSGKRSHTNSTQFLPKSRIRFFKVIFCMDWDPMGWKSPSGEDLLVRTFSVLTSSFESLKSKAMQVAFCSGISWSKTSKDEMWSWKRLAAKKLAGWDVTRKYEGLVLSHNTLILQWVAIIWIHVHEGNPYVQKPYQTSNHPLWTSIAAPNPYHTSRFIIFLLEPLLWADYLQQKKPSKQNKKRSTLRLLAGGLAKQHRSRRRVTSWQSNNEDLQKADSGGPDFINRDLPVVVGNFAGFLVLSLVRV